MPTTKKDKTVIETLQKDALVYALSTVAPGSPLREGLNLIMKGGMGAIVVLGNDEKVMNIAHGGFDINCPYTPTKLFELAKMDGAIILTNDLKKINTANTHLIPDVKIDSEETGMRHRSSQKTAKQSGNLVVAISERKRSITIYIGDVKYELQESNDIMTKAAQAMQTLEKYRKAVNEILINLTSLEFENSVTLFDILQAIQKMELTDRIVRELERYIIELGVEGRLTEMQMKELTFGLEKEYTYLLNDYIAPKKRNVVNLVKKDIENMKNDNLLDFKFLSETLGYENVDNLDIEIVPKGYRILNKINKINFNISEKIIKKFKSLDNVVSATPEDISDVEGISLNRAKYIRESISRIRGQTIVDLYKEI